MKTTNPRGRPSLPDEQRKVRTNVMLDAEVAELARRIGGGNLSEGLRLAVLASKKLATPSGEYHDKS